MTKINLLPMNEIKPCTLIAENVKNKFKETTEKFVAKDNAFSFMSSVRGAPKVKQ